MIIKGNDVLKMFDDMKESLINSPVKIEVPPPSFITMKAKIEEYEKNKRMIVSLPVEDHQTNPVGVMQGGFIAAAFDNTFGPLSYLVAKRPMTTIDMSVQYIRGVETGQTVFVETWIVAKGFSTMSMAGEMKSAKGKLLATAITNLLIIKIPGR
jgi:uncharacterized protein (TIGR00369 family)